MITSHSFNDREGWIEKKRVRQSERASKGGRSGAMDHKEKKKRNVKEKGANVCTHLWRKHKLNS